MSSRNVNRRKSLQTDGDVVGTELIRRPVSVAHGVANDVGLTAASWEETVSLHSAPQTVDRDYT